MICKNDLILQKIAIKILNMKLSNNKILITGGATGIGLGLAERFIQENNTVIICGRRETALQEAQHKIPELIIKQCDLALPAERVGLFNWISEKHSDLNVLVNNAGIQKRKTLITDDDFFDHLQEELTINAEAPVHLTSLFLNLKNLSTIMNVTSGLAFVPMIKTPVYSASKSFFHSYTVSLRALVKSRNIEVIEIIPPALNTELGGKGEHDYAPPVKDFIDAIISQLKQGKNELNFGFSDIIIKAMPETWQSLFTKMNTLK